MKALFNLSVFVLIVGNFTPAISQGFEVSGTVLDAESGQPIPFANIAIKDIYKGTASNELGEFSFKADSLPIVLVVSHLSYEPLEIEVTGPELLTVELKPGKLLMSELVIKGKGNNQFAYNLIAKAYNNITSQSYKSQYGKAFYRQISKNGEEYSELYEIFYDTRYTLNGVEDWAIQEGRYALKLSTADSFIYNKNFTLMVRLLTIVQPKTEDLIMPVSEHVHEQYDLDLEQMLSVNNREVARIRFTKKEYVKLPAMEGVISIDVKSGNVLKIQGKIVNDNLKFITLKSETGSWKNYNVTFEIGFKPLDDELLALDYMRLGQNFDYYQDDVFVSKVETRSFLSYYEYYKPPKRKKLGGRLLRFNESDSEVLDNIGYNQSFWDENIIVKRTPLEASVIASFEEERAFGSIYLNNKNQIVLEDYEIDSDPFIVRIREQLKKYYLPKNGEKVYLHLDKPYYASGERAWLKAYVVNMASNAPVKGETVLNVDLLSPDGGVALSGRVYTGNGFGHAQIDLPSDLESGAYVLRAHTDKMKGFRPLHFRTKLEIYNPSPGNREFAKGAVDSVNAIMYFPEGGKLIESMPTQIGFLAKNRFGDPMAIKGRLIGEDGRQVSVLKSGPGGPGSIFIMPRSDFTYYPMISSHEIDRNEFPEVEKTGYVVMINNLKPNTIDVSVRGSAKFEGDKFYLLVISNGVLYDRRIGSLTRGLYKTEIPKANLPGGISQILLVDESGAVQCKRLVFLNQPEEVVVNYYLAKKEFRKRERIDLVLDLQDQNGKSVNNASISVSVTDKDKVFRGEDERNIRSYLSLGYLTDHLFKHEGDLFNHDRETLKNLDFLMLSQQSVVPQIASFDTLRDMSGDYRDRIQKTGVSGIATDAKTGDPISDGVLKMISFPDPSMGFIYAKTDTSGRFRLDQNVFGDSVEMVVIAFDRRGKTRKTNIAFEKQGEMIKPEGFISETVEMPKRGREYIEMRQREMGEMEASQPEEMMTGLKQSFEMQTLTGRPDFNIKPDGKQKEAENLLDLFYDRFPGIAISGRGAEAKVQVKGRRGTPLVLYDGLTIRDYIEMAAEEPFTNSLSLTSTAKFLAGLKPAEVARIEIFKDNGRISEYFDDSYDGIICIYSMPGTNKMMMPGKNGFALARHTGFVYPEKFIAPEYLSRNNEIFTPDSRTTLYWNPEIKTNRRGRAKIGFYNSDDARNLQICIEGITSDGIPIFDIYEIGRDSKRERLN
ncbi:MAG: carboxypeptidase-like regulatory domain-containing protein [Cytophagales bacterium]|nr:carboxypeptidase-like regulatory domain-containing protein [Cytophagales bacterium]